MGAPGRIRTCGTWFRKPLLYPLSYGGNARSIAYSAHGFGSCDSASNSQRESLREAQGDCDLRFG